MKKTEQVMKKKTATPAKVTKSGSWPRLENVDITGEVAVHYGFMPITSPKITPDDHARLDSISETTPTKNSAQNNTLHNNLGNAEERLAILRIFHDEDARLPQPAMLYCKRPFAGSDSRRKPGFETCGLEILGVTRPSAEALIIQTVWAQLFECGAENMRLEVNSIGDKESFARFEREFSVYIKKNINAMPATLREDTKENHYALFDPSLANTDDERIREIIENAPRPMNFLSEVSRLHFKEVLEFLESAEIPYQVNDALMPGSRLASHTVFEIRGSFGKGGSDMLLASGSRFNSLARKVGYKKEVAYCSAIIWYPKKIAERHKSLDKFKPARFYVVQLGALAKLRTLSVIELLRREKIPVHHSLTRENLASQMASAEYLRVTHLLIIGQKEAIEQSVVVRSMDIREQETVRMNMLVEYLKNILAKL